MAYGCISQGVKSSCSIMNDEVMLPSSIGRGVGTQDFLNAILSLACAFIAPVECSRRPDNA